MTGRFVKSETIHLSKHKQSKVTQKCMGLGDALHLVLDILVISSSSAELLSCPTNTSIFNRLVRHKPITRESLDLIANVKSLLRNSQSNPSIYSRSVAYHRSVDSPEQPSLISTSRIRPYMQTYRVSMAGNTEGVRLCERGDNAWDR